MATGKVGHGRSLGVDRLVLALAAVLIVVGAAATDTASPDARGFDWLAVALLALGCVAVATGGRAPGVSALAALAVTYAWYGAGFESGLVNVVTMAAFYRLGASEGQRRKVAIAVAAVVATTVMMLAIGDESWQDTATATGYVVMAVLFGELLRNRQLVLDRYAERAARAEADADRRLVEERIGIARDVHDVLAHTVSVMTVQANVAADSLDQDRARTAAALDAIRTEGRRAMDEVRAIVAVLRAPADRPGVGIDPAPRLDRLGELVDSARTHGIAVDLEVEVDAGSLPELVELTAFRVVQESLTNVVRHAAGASTATVSVRRADGTLAVEVRDDGRAPGPVLAGFGLRGMAERVEAIGGTLHHGADDDQGFVVRASLPVLAGSS